MMVAPSEACKFSAVALDRAAGRIDFPFLVE